MSELIGFAPKTEAAPMIEVDNGELLQYFSKPLDFGSVTHYYQFACPPQGGQLLSWDKNKYLKYKGESNTPTTHKGGRFLEMTTQHPERYAYRLLAYLNRIGSVKLSEAKTQAVVAKMANKITQQQPLEFALCYSWQKFPLAEEGVDIKVGSKLPDISDLEFLHVMWSMGQLVKSEIYPPGLHITVFNEAKAYQGFSAYSPEELDHYEEQIKKWTALMSWDETIKFDDLLSACMTKPGYLDLVDQKYQKYLQEFEDKSIGDNTFIKAETRNVYLPSIGIHPSQDMLLRIYTESGFGSIVGLKINWDEPTAEDTVVWQTILQQAKAQAAYSRAFMDTRYDFGSVYNEDQVALTITTDEDKIIIPTGNKKAQEAATHYQSGGLKILPTAGKGILLPQGVATLPVWVAKQQTKNIKYSQELKISYPLAYE